jgi:hypothetical protein
MKLLGPNDLIWSYNKLCRHGSHRALIQIERDSKYPDMWRVVRADGSLSGERCRYVHRAPGDQ